MRIDELIKKIQKQIKHNLNHKDLQSLCSLYNFPVNGRKTFIQDKLSELTRTLEYDRLLQISNQIDEYIRAANRSRQKPIENVLTDRSLKSAPINLEEEVPPNLRSEIALPFTGNQSVTIVPLQTAPGVNERLHNVRLPNIVPSVTIATSPFYSCSVCLSPMTLLVPQIYPNISQPGRNMSHQNLSFVLTENARSIVARNTYRIGNKVEYKWQVLLRFVGVDPSDQTPIGEARLQEMIPPYLHVSVNGVVQPLWEILPSNCKTKEGKRHAKPVQVSDKVTEGHRATGGYKHVVAVNWWQTPGVFMYYYMGVFLERKLTVKEMMNLFLSSSQISGRFYDDTVRLIQSKLGNVSQTAKTDNDDDDLVISNVLPINLCCPVGKSRIVIPLRTKTCQHLQCFDAHLFLSMNERRPVWKCPVCDNPATPDDLFCDKYFENILNHFKNDDEVTDVNVHPDHSYVAMKRNRDRGDRENMEKSSTLENSVVTEIKDQPDQDLIVLDSDEESEEAPSKRSAPANPSFSSIPLPPSKEIVNQLQPTVVPQPIATPSITPQNCSNKNGTNDINRRIPAQPQPIACKPPQPPPVLTPSPMTMTTTTITTTSSVSKSFSSSSVSVSKTTINVSRSTNNNSQYASSTVTSSSTPVTSSTGMSVTNQFVKNTSSSNSSASHSNNITLTAPVVNLSRSNQFNSVSTPTPTTTVTSPANRVQTTIPPVGYPITVIGNLNKTVSSPMAPANLNTSSITSSKPNQPSQPPPLMCPATAHTQKKSSIPSFQEMATMQPITVEQALDINARKQKENPIGGQPGNISSSSLTPSSGNIGGSGMNLFTQSSSRPRSDPKTPTQLNNNNSTATRPIVPIQTPIATESSRFSQMKSKNISSDNIDVIRALPVTVSVRDQSRNNNQIGDSDFMEPIVCPASVFQKPPPMQPQPQQPQQDPQPNGNETQSNDDNATSASARRSPTNKKNETSKKNKSTQNKVPSVPASGVIIPTLCIDLTEDDETQQKSPPVPLKPSAPFTRKPQNENLKWCPVNGPIPSNLKPNGVNPSNRFSYYDKTKDSNKRSFEPGINHFKPHQMKFGINNNLTKQNNITKPQQHQNQQQSIDLTGDDEDEEKGNKNESDDDVIPVKRLRSNNDFSNSKNEEETEDGQVDDSDSCSSEESLMTNKINRNFSRTSLPVACNKKK